MEIALQKAMIMREQIAISIRGMKLIGLLAYTPVWSQIALFILGLFILMPQESFTTVVFSVFLSIAPEWVWGAIFSAVGAMGSVITMRSVRRRASYYACATATTAWILFAVEFWLSSPESIGIPIFILFAIGAMTILIPESFLARV